MAGRGRTHDGIFALCANETGFTAVVSTPVLMVLHASVKLQTLTQCLEVEHAMEIDPFAAVVRPGLAPKRFPDAALQQFLFELMEMLANHAGYYGTGIK